MHAHVYYDNNNVIYNVRIFIIIFSSPHTCNSGKTSTWNNNIFSILLYIKRLGGYYKGNFKMKLLVFVLENEGRVFFFFFLFKIRMGNNQISIVLPCFQTGTNLIKPIDSSDKLLALNIVHYNIFVFVHTYCVLQTAFAGKQ